MTAWPQGHALWPGLSLPLLVGIPFAAVDLAAQTDAPAAPAMYRATDSRPVARFPFPIYDVVAPAPDDHAIAVLQTRPRPIVWVVPCQGEPFAFREDWAAFLPRWAASGDRIGFISAGGPPRVWTVEVDPTTGRAMAPPRLLIRTVTGTFGFAPDGERIALVPRASIARGASEIHVVEHSSRRSRVLVRDTGLIYWLDWAPDGRSIYYGLAPLDPDSAAAHLVRRVTVATGSTSTVRQVGEYLGLAPDGDRLLFRPIGEDGPALRVATLDGERELEISIDGSGSTPRWSGSGDALLQVRTSANGDEIWSIPLPAGAATPAPAPGDSTSRAR